jgi:sugar O-acyltransferase (sialic acid O-acetyltransferase NeuD family)
MKRIAIIGAGVLGQQIAHYIRTDQGFEPIGFFDDHVPVGTKLQLGQVLGIVNDVGRFYDDDLFDQLIIGIGYSHSDYRWKCFRQFHLKIPFLTFAHSSCFIDSTAKIGDGSFLMPGSVVDNEVIIGKNVFIQIGCSISHHSTLGDNSFLAPGVKIAGFVDIGKSCFLGIGTVCIDSISVCANTRSGAGAVVTKPIPESGLYVGIPAKRVK